VCEDHVELRLDLGDVQREVAITET